MSDITREKTLDAVQQNAQATAQAFSALGDALARRSEFAPIALRAHKRAAELEANKFTVMVVGEFKRGKSTVLNAMLGAVALPMNVTPCTAVVTFVRHGPEPEVLVAFNDGRIPNPGRISLQEFDVNYRLVGKDTAGARHELSDRFGDVDHAVLHYPSAFLENGVEIVDTPGLNESDIRTRRVFENLATADAVVLVLDAIAVANSEEIKFIENRLRPLGLHKHLFFLINRWNQLTLSALNPNDPAEVGRMLRDQEEFISTRLAPFASAAGSARMDQRIFRIDALGALRQRLNRASGAELEATQMPAFERALCEYLTADRDEARRDKDRTIAEGIAREISTNAEALLRKAREPITNFAAEEAKFQAQTAQLERIRINIVNIITSLAAEAAVTLGQSLQAYLEQEMYGRLEKHVDEFDLGELDSIWTQWKALGDVARAEENKIVTRIQQALALQVGNLVKHQLDDWRKLYLEPELKQRVVELKKRLSHETAEYVRIIAEIQGDEVQSGRVSDEDILRKIAEWGRDYRADFVMIVAGASFDVSPIVAGIVAEIVFHIAAAGLTAGVSLVATGIFALVRKEYFKKKIKKQIVDGLKQRKRELFLDQEHQLGKSVEQGFKKFSDPISQSIESEIAVIKGWMTDLLKQRQKADFDADFFEEALNALLTTVRSRVNDIRQLAG